MARAPKRTVRQETDSFLLERLQAILVNAAKGQRSIVDDRQYTSLRRELMRRLPEPPALLATHPTVDSYAAMVMGEPDRPARTNRILAEFTPLLTAAHAQEAVAGNDGGVHSAGWTGIDDPVVRLVSVQRLLPLARAGIKELIDALSQSGGNYGPILDERQEAINDLRELHRILGEVLHAADSGHLEDRLGDGLAAEAVRFAKRATDQLRNDPMPFVANALIMGILSACGLGVPAAILGGAAQAVRKDKARPAK